MRTMNADVAMKIRHIRKAIIEDVDIIRREYPLLNYQNTLGFFILLVALLGLVGSSCLYLYEYIPWWLCLLFNAFFISITQEIEHDLIHGLYFKDNRLVHNTMMALAWLARPSTTNPWVRRKLHLKHHQISGTEEDLEERALTNGFRWGLPRILMMADLMMASMMLVIQTKTWKGKAAVLWIGFKSYFPVTFLTWGLWYYFLAYHAVDWLFKLMGNTIFWAEGTLQLIHYLDIAVIILIAPNVLWTFCLHFISSNMHYYGDIQKNNVIQQTQVLNSRWFWPLQAFCFNFGSTHSIHHFVVNEPFYIRQLTVNVAHDVMKQMGVRFNDYGSFLRANRWGKTND